MKRIVPALALAVLAAACGQQKKADEAAPAAPSTVVSTPDGTVTVNGPGGANINVNGGSVVVAGQLPAFAPAYPGGTTVTTIAANEQGKVGGVYAFTTGDAADKVFGFYRGKAEAAGLSSQTNIDAGGARIYGAQGPAGDLSVTAAPQGQGVTYVQVTWSTGGRG